MSTASISYDSENKFFVELCLSEKSSKIRQNYLERKNRVTYLHNRVTVICFIWQKGEIAMIKTTPFYQIRAVEETDREKVNHFIQKMRVELFPMLRHEKEQNDFVRFFEREDATLFAAFLTDGTVVGTIGVVPYDGRFSFLYKNERIKRKTAEIVKCYVEKQYRRKGIGSRLFQQSVSFCKKCRYERLYLHSHPFLPGGIPFWHALGFRDLFIDDDPIWQTQHMEMSLR